jgi:hypothetical protein
MLSVAPNRFAWNSIDAASMARAVRIAPSLYTFRFGAIEVILEPFEGVAFDLKK